jgi:uncharacterized membrane protein
VPPAGPPSTRKTYLDWLRGLAVLIMIEAHVFDAWTAPTWRETLVFGWSMVLGGMGAPLFLFLAGVAGGLAAEATLRSTGDRRAGAGRVERRGWQIFGYAFLFRLQSWLLSRGAPLISLLKVDVLNVMGPSIAASARVWSLGATPRVRGLLLSVVTIAIAMVTPIVRDANWLAVLPDPIEWYLRPSPGHTNFTLLPWSGFVAAGMVLGIVLDGRSPSRTVSRTFLWVAAAGVALTLGGYALSLRPPLYPRASFWTSSPTFFFMRLGLLVMSVVAAYVWSRRPWPRMMSTSPLEVFGIGSLFVYWVHVELVYGAAGSLFRRRLTLPQTFVAYLLVVVAMYVLLHVWNLIRARWRRARASQ